MSGYPRSNLCKVYLCSTPLQQGNFINGAVNALSLVTSSSQSASGNSWAKHWFLVFDYGEDKVLVCEADNHGGELTGHTYWKKRAVLESCENKKYLAKRNISKRRINQLLRKMCDCGDYHFTDDNCQKWVQDLLRELDIEMPAGEVDARTVMANYIQPGAVAGAAIVGAGVVAALIYGATSRRNKRD